jgi:DUF1365 family protein
MIESACGHAVYAGTVWHDRRAPAYRFTQQVEMAWIDLGHLDTISGRSWLLHDRWWSPARFLRSDYHGDVDVPLGDAVRDTVAASIGERPDGPVYLLAHLRTWGHCFNPIAVYWCYDATGLPVAEMLEVTNTPWHERHSYVFDRRAQSTGDESAPIEFTKAMHVSPFLPMDLDYTLHDSPPTDRVDLRLSLAHDDVVVFDAGFVGARRPLDAAAIRRIVFRRPTQAVWLGIHGHALRLWRHGARFLPHPGRRRAATAADPSIEHEVTA